MTAMPEQIIVPTDGSEAALRAAGLAGAMAAPHSSCRVVLLYVISDQQQMPSELSGLDQDVSPGELRDSDRQRAEQALSAAEQKVREHGCDAIEQRIRVAHDAAEEIIEVVNATPRAMVVTGRRGLSTFRELLVGSVSQKLVHHCRCPVTLIS